MTNERMIAAQMAVQKNSSMVRLSVSASVMLSRIAVMIRENSPRMRSVKGRVRRRRIVPTTALTSPNSAETQR